MIAKNAKNAKSESQIYRRFARMNADRKKSTKISALNLVFLIRDNPR